ncbi:MAG: hypothetical protein KKA73_25090 [Chloroflexi bacterium]|nr:hypothetical protein [Chloroflexota bacterium]MBU1750973.1 hypothetical protein [Chloroflexota bacterium]
MKKRTRTTLFLSAGLMLVLLAVPAIVNAGAPVGSTFVVRAASTEPAKQPAIAYNSEWQEYLVVFWNDRPGCDDIRAERVSRTGQVLGGRWIAAGCPNEHRYPDVAYNTQRNEYLIVWAEESGGYSYVRTQRFTADLQPMTEGQQTLIVGPFSTYTSINPAVAYSSNSDKYLVVWELEVIPPTPAAVSIAGHAVGGNGIKDPAGSFNVSLDPGGQPRRLPDVAYNRHANGFLVVWQQWNGTSVWDVYGQLVNGNGTLPPTPLPIQVAWYVQSSMAPAVAAIPTTPTAYKYLVVWAAEVSPGNWDIYGKLVEENGTPHPNHFAIATDPAAESNPAVAGTEYGHQYLVTWRLPRGPVDVPILGRPVSYAGALVADPAEFPGPAADYPAVAAGPAGDFLVAWQDQPLAATSTNIYGQFWGNRVYLPLVVRNH